jgi:hypothetical protein
MSYADWSAAHEEGAVAFGYGVGLELEQVSLLGRLLPVRLGYKRADLPFRFDGEAPSESAWTAGIGFNMAQVGSIPLARVDFAIEAGSRSAGSLSESFRRATMTVRVAGR